MAPIGSSAVAPSAEKVLASRKGAYKDAPTLFLPHSRHAKCRTLEPESQINVGLSTETGGQSNEVKSADALRVPEAELRPSAEVFVAQQSAAQTATPGIVPPSNGTSLEERAHAVASTPFATQSRGPAPLQEPALEAMVSF